MGSLGKDVKKKRKMMTMGMVMKKGKKGKKEKRRWVRAKVNRNKFSMISDWQYLVTKYVYLAYSNIYK